jgi:transcriptional regulator with XRE-family HTH domain
MDKDEAVTPRPRQLEPLGYEALAIELVRALRGRRSQRAFSRRLGYSSNVAQRWESGECWPTAARFFDGCRSLRVSLTQVYEHLHQRSPTWNALSAEDAVAAFLSELRGKTPLIEIAEACGTNRYSVARWLKGQAQPMLPTFLQLVDVMSGRMPDLIASMVDPTKLPTLADRWGQLQRARKLAYEDPWGHALLRALQLDTYVSQQGDELVDWLSERLSIDKTHVRVLFERLHHSGLISNSNGRWHTDHIARVPTGGSSDASFNLKKHWLRTASHRLETRAPGSFGFSLFEISKQDLVAVRELHLQFVTDLQRIVSNSTNTDRVGLYCAQLIDLSASDNALTAKRLKNDKDAPL